MRLHVDKAGLKKAFKKSFERNLSLAAKTLENDIKRNTSLKIFGLSRSPEVYTELLSKTNEITIKILGNMEFIVDNYGTGSLMSKSNPYLDEYKNSDKWNEARNSNNIVGRPKSSYIDLFGRKRNSSGRMKGMNLENRTLYISKENKRYYFKPIPPTNALHYALSWFYEDWFPKFYNKAIQEVNVSQYLKFK